MKFSAESLERARTIVESRLGLDFRGVRAPHLERALGQALRAASVPTADVDVYLDRLASLPDASPELMRLATHLTIGETYFFRDSASFDALEQIVLPERIASHRRAGIWRLRLWSAGCATGEEPYSLAILLDRLLVDADRWDVRILATDVNPAALAGAGRGRYREWSLRATPPWIRSRYFADVGNGLYEIDPRMRTMVTFMPLNLADAAYPPAAQEIDLLLCRNVLMYFSPEAVRHTVSRLQAAVAEGGWLMTAPAEATADLLRPLTAVNFPGAILFQKRPPPVGPSPDRSAASLRTHALVAPEEEPGGKPPEGPGREGMIDRPPALAQQARQRPECEALLERAQRLADRGRLDDARRACEAALANDALYLDGYLLLATIDQEAGDSEAALAALRRALYLDPDCPLAHFLLGALQLRRGERARGKRSMAVAEELLRAIPADDPVSATADVGTGRLLEAARAYLHSAAEPGR